MKSLFLSLFFFLSFPVASLASTAPVSVSGYIGESRITLFGYSSPHSRIELTSSRVFAVTYSQADGYFVFDRTLLPKNPSDLCLTAIDDNHRQSLATCIPPPPPVNYHTDIGPIILPPTISLDVDQIKPNATVAASGQSLPNAPIIIYLYQKDDRPSFYPQPVQAYSLPALHLTTDDQGHYSFNLPTSYATNYRLFSAVDYLSHPSPKSNTLNYSLPSFWSLFWLQYRYLLITLSLFIITLGVFIYLLIRHPHPRRYLPAIFSYPLALPFKSSK